MGVILSGRRYRIASDYSQEEGRMEMDDRVNFPGGYDVAEALVAVLLASRQHIEHPTFTELEGAVMKRFLEGLAARHPESVPFADPYLVRADELFNERRSLLNSHLKLTWFSLSYWAYGLVAVRAGLSVAEFDDLSVIVTPVRRWLRELGIQVSDAELLTEVDRFLPNEVTPWSVNASSQLFLSFVRFLHNGALRRREVITPRMNLPAVCVTFTEADAEEARTMSTFLTTHGVSIIERPTEVTREARLLVLLSRQAMGAELFWRGLADWKERQVRPMVVCLMPKAELYHDAPADWRREVWMWLSDNVAVELNTETNRYVMLLRALDSIDPKQWWWNKADAVELGLAVDVFRLGIPRPAPPREASRQMAREPYPYRVDGALFGTCLMASDRLTRDEASGPDARYFGFCEDRLQLRIKPNGEPYALPWVVLVYRSWLAFADRLPGFVYTAEDVVQAEREMQAALFALGVGSSSGEVPAFLRAVANLPWASTADTLAAVDERTVAFLIQVYHLSQAALARGQRMRLRCPYFFSFISYARQDEAMARQLVLQLEAKGADVWFDLNAITLGSPLDGSLRSAVGDAKYLILIATPDAAKSGYVRLEVETAIRRGLRIVPIVPGGPLPEDLRPWLDSAAVEPAISAGPENEELAKTVLARLDRSPSEQLQWLQSQPSYDMLRQHLAQARSVQK